MTSKLGTFCFFFSQNSINLEIKTIKEIEFMLFMSILKDLIFNTEKKKSKNDTEV